MSAIENVPPLRDAPSSWTDANQRVLVQEFARLKAQLSGGDARPARRAAEEARAALPAPAAIDRVAESFGLSGFERDLLLLCAGVELDADLAGRCAAASEMTNRPHVTFGLALAALADPHWSAIAPVHPLRQWRLLEVKDEQALATSRLSIDERVLHYLAGVNYLDTRLRPLLQSRPLPRTLAESHSSVVDRLLHSLTEHEGLVPIVQLLGDDGAGQKDIAVTVSERLDLRLYVVRAADIPTGMHESAALALLWHREAVLLGSALFIDCDDGTASAVHAARLANRTGGLIFVGAAEAILVHARDLRLVVNKPGAAEQKNLWTEALGPDIARLNGAIDGVATQFRLSAETIARTGNELRAALDRSERPDAVLWQTCRASVRGGLDALAQRIEPAATWNDLVLPQNQLSTLREVAAHVKHRFTVYDGWGFAGRGARGLGITALFFGESGTGKTMAAEVLGNELHLDLYRIDLSSVVSKYIGETEKNLRRVFDAAEDSGAILLFDEADALFGKRSEVTDSHDRYANIEVSYLLQRMEAYRGLAILTTNMKRALDAAFLRRIRFVVQFPFPDAQQRELIWRGIFPTATPLQDVDFVKLARLNVSGGSIRNIALHAAFLAADEGRAVAMSHLLHASRADAAKRERTLLDREIGEWV